jgi:hypothetical protein
MKLVETFRALRLNPMEALSLDPMLINVLLVILPLALGPILVQQTQ